MQKNVYDSDNKYSFCKTLVLVTVFIITLYIKVTPKYIKLKGRGYSSGEK